MKNLVKVLLVLFFFFSGTESFAQKTAAERFAAKVADRMKKRAVQKAEDKVMERADRGVDKVIDGLFGKADKGTKKVGDAAKDAVTGSNNNKKESSEDSSKDIEVENAENPMGILDNLFGNTPAPASSYEFSSSYIMIVTSHNGKESMTMRNKYYFTPDGDYVGIKMLENSNAQVQSQAQAMDAMVMDLEKNAMFTFMTMNGQKTTMAISLNGASTKAANDYTQNQLDETTYTKTSQTKRIAGYNCDGYLMKDAKSESMVWISRSRVPVVSRYYQSFQKAASSGNNKQLAVNYNTNDFVYKMAKEGRAMLGMTTTDKKGDSTEMEVEEIRANDSFSFSTAGYGNMMDIEKIMRDAQNQNTQDD